MNLESCTATLIEFIASSEHVMVPLTGPIHTTSNNNTGPTAAASSSHNSSAAHSRTSSMHSLGSGQHHSRTASANVAATSGVGASADPQLQLEDPNMHPVQLLADGSSVTAHEALSHFSPQLSDRHHFSNSFRPVARVLSRCPRTVVDSFIHLIHHHFVAPLINAASTQGQTSLRDQVRSGKLTKYIVTDGNGLRTMAGGGQFGSDDVDDAEDTFIVPYVAPIVLQYDLSKSTEEGSSAVGVPNTVTTASTSSPIHSSSTIGEGGIFSSGLDVDNLEVFAVLYTLDDCITFLCLHLLHGTANNKINDDGSDVTVTTTTAQQHRVNAQHGSGATVNHTGEDFSGDSAFDLGEYPSYSEHLPPLHPSSSPKQQQQSGNDVNSSNAIMAYVWHTCGAWLLDLCEAFYRIQSVEQQQQDDEEENEIRQQKQRNAGKKQTPHFQTGGISTGIASHKSAYIPATGWSPIGCFTKSLTYITKKEEQHTAATTGSGEGNSHHLLTSSDIWGSIADTLELYERQMYRLYRTGRAKSGDASAVLLELPAADGVRTATSVFMEQPLNGLLDEVESIDAERRFEQGGKGIVGLIMKASFFTALDCRVSAVRVQPNNAVALNNLGVQLAMPPPAFTSHDGDDESDDETNLNGMPSVIRIDRTTLGRLGGGLASLNNTISSLHDDGNNTPTASASQLQSYTKQQCYLRAIEADSTFGLPWKNLADTITVPKSVVTVDDEQECGVLVGERLYSREDCVVECILRDPTNPDAWNHLGCLLAEREIRRAAAPKPIATTTAVPVREGDEALSSREPDSETVATATTTDEGEAGDELSASTLPPLKSKSYLGREGTQESVLRSAVGGSQQRRRAMDDMDADSPAFALIGESAVTKVHCFIKSLELCEDVTGDVWNNLGAALQDNFIVGDGGKGDSKKKKKKKVSKKSDEKRAKKKEQQETTTTAPFGNESEEASYAANTVAAVKLVLSGDVERIGENAGGNSVTQSSSSNDNNNSIFNVTQGVKQSVPSMVRINGEWFSKEDCLEKARQLGCDGADENIEDMKDVRRDLQERYGKQAKEGGGGGCVIQ